jgi:hypothetical protein
MPNLLLGYGIVLGNEGEHVCEDCHCRVCGIEVE